MSQQKDEGNSAFGQSGSRKRRFNPNIPTSAELEFSDNMENMPQIVTQAPNSFNSSGTLKSRKSFISEDNTNRRKSKSPIRVKRKSPWLIPAKTTCNNSTTLVNEPKDDDDHKTQRPEEPFDIINNIIQRLRYYISRSEAVSAGQKTDLLKYTPPSSTKELPAVKPVNTLKDNIDLIPTMRPNWLSNLMRREHEESGPLSRQRIKDQEKNVQLLARETEELERFFEKRLENSIIGSKMEEDDDSQVNEEEFPEIAEEDIKNAICGPTNEVLISKFNLQITRSDIRTLEDDKGLNDEIINFYMNLLIKRGEERCSDDFPRVYAMNTFFITRLMQSGYAGVRRWTRKVDLFSYDIILVPVYFRETHSMVIIDLKNKSIKYYDFEGSHNTKFLKVLEKFIQDECMDKRKETFNTSDFVKESVRDVPRGVSESDSGVFSCMAAEYICRRKQITFLKEHMPYFRKKMILEIVKGKLLL